MKTKILIVLLLMGVGFPFISSAKLLALSLEKSNPLENLVTAAHSIAKLEGAPISFDNTKESVENDRKESSNSEDIYMVCLFIYAFLEVLFIAIENQVGDLQSKKNRLNAASLAFAIGGLSVLAIFYFNPYIGVLVTVRTLCVVVSFWKNDCKK